MPDYSNYHLFSVSQISCLCWVSLCWMSLCWMSLYWMSWRHFYSMITNASFQQAGNIKGVSLIVPLTSCLTGLESAVWQLTIFVFIWKNRLIQTSQKGDKWYSDTSPFSIPCSRFQLYSNFWNRFKNAFELKKVWKLV